MPAKVFVDSNIWLYSLIQQSDGDARHQRSVDILLQLVRPVISSQVIREICSNLIKKLHMPEEQLRVLILSWYQDCELITSNVSQHLFASELRKS